MFKIKYRPTYAPRELVLLADCEWTEWDDVDKDGEIIVRRSLVRETPLLFPNRRKARKYARGMLHTKGMTTLPVLIIDEDGESVTYKQSYTQPKKCEKKPETEHTNPVRISKVERMKDVVRDRADHDNYKRSLRKGLSEDRDNRVKLRLERDREIAAFREECFLRSIDRKKCEVEKDAQKVAAREAARFARDN